MRSKVPECYKSLFPKSNACGGNGRKKCTRCDLYVDYKSKGSDSVGKDKQSGDNEINKEHQ